MKVGKGSNFQTLQAIRKKGISGNKKMTLSGIVLSEREQVNSLVT